jgi:molybdopterin converting factor small subunit
MKITLEISFSFKHELDTPQLTLALPEGADILAALHSLVTRYPHVRSRLFTASGEVHRHITDILAALHSLVTRYPHVRSRLFTASGEVHRHINALINGGNASFKQGFHTILRDGDHLTILPPVGGG